MIFYGTKNLYEYLNTQNKKFFLYQQLLLATITLSTNNSIWLYEKNKITCCQRILINIRIYNFGKNKITQKLIIFLLFNLNNNIKITAITINSPTSKNINIKIITLYITNKKNVDNICFTNKKKFSTCVATAIKYVLKKINKKFKNLKAIIIGKTPTVGQPILNELLNNHINTMICDLNYTNLNEDIKTADLIVLTTNKAQIIQQKLLKNNSTILDVGIIINKKKILGNLKLKKKKKLPQQNIQYTKVPGGIGPITIMILIKNIKNCIN